MQHSNLFVTMLSCDDKTPVLGEKHEVSRDRAMTSQGAGNRRGWSRDLVCACLCVAVMVAWMAFIQHSTHQLAVLQADVSRKLQQLAALDSEHLAYWQAARGNENDYGRPVEEMSRSGRYKRSKLDRGDPGEPARERSGKKSRRRQGGNRKKEGSSSSRDKHSDQHGLGIKFEVAEAIINNITESLLYVSNRLNTVKTCETHPSIHVIPVHGSSYSGDRGNLHWSNTPSHSTTRAGHNTGLNHSFSMTEERVSVPQTGLYHVYAQITYNGQQDIPVNLLSTFVCAFTVRIGADTNTSRAVLYGGTTQYKLGRKIHVDPNRTTRAHDSIFVSGVFHIEQGQSIGIRHEHNCKIKTEPNKSFFGAYLLSPISGQT